MRIYLEGISTIHVVKVFEVKFGFSFLMSPAEHIVLSYFLFHISVRLVAMICEVFERAGSHVLGV